MSIALPTDSDLERLLAHKPQVVSTAVGPIEVAEAGAGTPLLSVHGSGGGSGYALGMAAVFALNGFRVIAPSRPGYHRTPLMTGRSYEQQADALAALLDALDVERTAVFGFSGGGAPSYLLAARHPEAVSALVEVGALSTALEQAASPVVSKVLFSRVGMSLLGGVLRGAAALRHELGVRMLMMGETSQSRSEVAALATRVVADPVRMAFVTRVWLAGTRRVGSWLPGQRNDNALMAALTPLPLAGIQCPTLIVQGTADTAAAPHSAYAADQIPGSEVRSIPNGSHRGLWVGDDAAEQQEYVIAWLRAHAQPRPRREPVQ